MSTAQACRVLGINLEATLCQWRQRYGLIDRACRNCVSCAAQRAPQTVLTRPSWIKAALRELAEKPRPLGTTLANPPCPAGELSASCAGALLGCHLISSNLGVRGRWG